MCVATICRHRFFKRRHQLVRLLMSFRGVQTKMGAYNPQNSLADQKVCIDRPTGLVAGHSQIDHPRCQYRKSGKNRIAEAEAGLVASGACNDPAASGES